MVFDPQQTFIISHRIGYNGNVGTLLLSNLNGCPALVASH